MCHLSLVIRSVARVLLTLQGISVKSPPPPPFPFIHSHLLNDVTTDNNFTKCSEEVSKDFMKIKRSLLSVKKLFQ